MSPVLLGGRKPVNVKKIVRLKRLDKGRDKPGALALEGQTFEVVLTVERKGKQRKIRLAEKKFYPGFESLVFKNPLKQFEIMSELKALNAREKLGLHIRPTIRLRKINRGKPRLILTLYDKLDINALSEHQILELQEQRHKERVKAWQNGFCIGADAWTLIKDPFTGKPTYYITDFGKVTKLKVIYSCPWSSPQSI